MDLTDKNQLINYLQSHGLWAKKSMGQNFLVNREALDKIVAAAELSDNDTVLEIGPGVGTLTRELLQRAGRVVAIEKDEKLGELLTQKLKPKTKNQEGEIQIIMGDALEFDTGLIFSYPEGTEGSKKEDSSQEVQNDPTSLTELRGTSNTILAKNFSPNTNNLAYKLVANIPYYITSKILEKFLSAKNKPSTIVLLVQKEVAERICAKPGSLSVLAISVQYFGNPEIVDIVKRDSFFPAPDVDSAILRIRIQPDRIQNSADEKAFFKVVKIGFRARRKTLFNNLKSGTNLNSGQIDMILDKMNLTKKVRAQELTLAQWGELKELIMGMQ